MEPLRSVIALVTPKQKLPTTRLDHSPSYGINLFEHDRKTEGAKLPDKQGS